jgi:hypothetical protein
MDISVTMFLACPAYVDAHGAMRCGLPAVIEDRYVARSTDGPLESVRIRCPRDHFFNGPIEFLTWNNAPGVPVQDHSAVDLAWRESAAGCFQTPTSDYGRRPRRPSG